MRVRARVEALTRQLDVVAPDTPMARWFRAKEREMLRLRCGAASILCAAAGACTGKPTLLRDVRATNPSLAQLEAIAHAAAAEVEVEVLHRTIQDGARALLASHDQDAGSPQEREPPPPEPPLDGRASCVTTS